MPSIVYITLNLTPRCYKSGLLFTCTVKQLIYMTFEISYETCFKCNTSLLHWHSSRLHLQAFECHARGLTFGGTNITGSLTLIDQYMKDPKLVKQQ